MGLNHKGKNPNPKGSTYEKTYGLEKAKQYKEKLRLSKFNVRRSPFSEEWKEKIRQAQFKRWLNIEKEEKQITPRIRFKVLQRDNFTCQYCGRSPSKHGIVLHIDHIIPKSIDNLKTACEECNFGKGNG